MFSALFSVMLLVSGNAAATPAAQAPTTNEAASAEEPKKICKREQVTGQLQGTKRVCLTAEQWRVRQEAIARAKR